MFDLTATEGRREAARAAVSLIHDMADPIDRDQYLQKLSASSAPGSTSCASSHGERHARWCLADDGQSRPQSLHDEPGQILEDQLQDLVLSLLLRAPAVEVWPEPTDFANSLHRAILDSSQSWPGQT